VRRGHGDGDVQGFRRGHGCARPRLGRRLRRLPIRRLVSCLLVVDRPVAAAARRGRPPGPGPRHDPFDRPDTAGPRDAAADGPGTGLARQGPRLGRPAGPVAQSGRLGGFKHPEWGRFTLGKTDPNFSTSGLNATIGTYFAATGRSSDLSAKDVSDPKVVAYVEGVEGSIVHCGDTTLTFLSNLQAADKAGQG
jgi:hypothetical protein